MQLDIMPEVRFEHRYFVWLCVYVSMCSKARNCCAIFYNSFIIASNNQYAHTQQSEYTKNVFYRFYFIVIIKYLYYPLICLCARLAINHTQKRHSSLHFEVPTFVYCGFSFVVITHIMSQANVRIKTILNCV